MNKLVISFIIAYIVLTAVILGLKPQMHKPVMLSAKQPVVGSVPEQNLEQETRIIHVQQYGETENIKLSPQNSEITEKPVNTGFVKPQIIQKNITTDRQKKQSQSKPLQAQTPAQQTQPSPKSKYELPQSIKDIVENKPQKPAETETIAKKQEPPIQQKQVEVKQNPQPAAQKPVQIQNNTPLTEAEEVIVWNKWRSDLQNKVMRDSKVVAERGTVFRFSFTVNKFGQISNLKVWSDTPAYTNYAIQTIKPLLLSYQGQPILNFPARTKRITTNVTGAFVISNQDKFTTPNDYSDIERVKR